VKEATVDDERYRATVDLVRRIRHDANSPITAALGHVQLLLEEPAAHAPDVLESLQIVEAQLKRLIEILNGLSEVRY
jgi:signal transduction histidine kinase